MNGSDMARSGQITNGGRTWATTSGRAADQLRVAVQFLPRAGIHRWPISVWPANTSMSPGKSIVVAEEHGGFAFGGNKVRQVDVLLGAALAAGADAVITSAGPQSNLCRVVAAAARHVGLEPHLLLRGQRPETRSGNQILYELAGAQEHWVAIADPFDNAQTVQLDELAGQLRTAGQHPAILDVRTDGGTLCALASSAIVDELNHALPDAPDRLVIAASAGNTAGGILAGLAARGSTVTLVAASAAGDAHGLRDRILFRACAALDAAGVDADLAHRVQLEVTDEFLGAGHGVPTTEGAEAQQLAGVNGIFLDLSYTAKAMAALLADPRPGAVVFVHTGGGTGIFVRRETA